MRILAWVRAVALAAGVLLVVGVSCARDAYFGSAADLGPSSDLPVIVACGDAFCSSGQVCVNSCCQAGEPCTPPTCGTLVVPVCRGGPCQACVAGMNCCGTTDPAQLARCDVTCFANFYALDGGQAQCHCPGHWRDMASQPDGG